MQRPALEVLPGGRESPDRRTALEELYQRCGASVYGRCVYLLQDRAAAEDAMQDVFAQAFLQWHTFRGQASPLTWLLKIATHHCLNQLRAKRAPWWKRFEQTERAKPSTTPGAEVAELRHALRAVLERFDLETQAAVVHHFVDEMTLEEVAALLGRSVPTIRKRLRHFAEQTGRELAP